MSTARLGYEYVRRVYGAHPVVGERVRHTVTDKYGTIQRQSRSHEHYVRVRFDGKPFSDLCHPTELDYRAFGDRP